MISAASLCARRRARRPFTVCAHRAPHETLAADQSSHIATRRMTIRPALYLGSTSVRARLTDAYSK